MESNYSDLKYINLLAKANLTLIETLNKSVLQYYKSKPTDFDELPNYKTPRPWEEKVINILNNYQIDIQKSIEQFSENDNESLSITVSIIGSLSKNLDNFDTCWMTEEFNEKYLNDLDYLIEIADNIESAL